jgi:hypothetical protein
MSTREDLLAYIKGLGRDAMSPDEIGEELSHLAKHGADWPKASPAEWMLEIDRMVADGALSRAADGTVRVPPPTVVRQGMLF